MTSNVNQLKQCFTIYRFEVLEPQIYNSNARQVPKSPEWFMSASAKIKVIGEFCPQEGACEIPVPKSSDLGDALQGRVSQN